MIGLIRQPKYSHLKELHKAVKLCERALLTADPTITSLGSYEKVGLFSILRVCIEHFKNDFLLNFL